MIELLVSIAFVAFCVSAAAYAFSNKPVVYKDDRTGRYIVPRSKTSRNGRRQHDE